MPDLKSIFDVSYRFLSLSTPLLNGIPNLPSKNRNKEQHPYGPQNNMFKIELPLRYQCLQIENEIANGR